MKNIDEKYTQYANDVLAGKIVACEYIKLACKRYLSLFQREEFYFNTELVDKVVRFIQSFKHYTGKCAGQNFKLEPFQLWIIYNIYGFWRVEDNTRLTTKVYIEMARKQGKSFLMSAIGLTELILMGEQAQQVQVVANSYKQAQLLFQMAQILCKQKDPKKKFFKQYRDSIQMPLTHSYLEVIASDPSKADGKNSGAFIVDEFHEASDTKMYNVLLSSQGFRSNPLAIVITTAGFNLLGPCYEMRKNNIEILQGAKVDDTQFTAIYTLDEGDDWRNEAVWVKSNPNLGITTTKKYIAEQIKMAINQPSNEVPVKTKTLNLWCSSSDVWITQDNLLKVTHDVNLDDFKGKDYTCYVGIDLASVCDLTAVTVLVPLDDKFYYKVFYYLPQSTLENNSNADLYKEWHRQGKLTITPGNVTDYDYVLHDLLKINKILPITRVSYDQWNSTQFTIQATDAGLNMLPYSQSIGNFNRPTRELERQIMDGTAVLDNNEINRYCFSNVVLKTDWNDNAKPVKTNNQNKIDGVISMLMALGGYLDNNNIGFEIYTS